jgi:glycine betaine/proline transport system permease protein
VDWLTDNKIPVGRTAAQGFDWLQANGAWVFDAIAIAMETLIEAILWVLQTPASAGHRRAFVAITWVLQRSWKTCLLVALGFLFILNQGYWRRRRKA